MTDDVQPRPVPYAHVTFSYTEKGATTGNTRTRRTDAQGAAVFNVSVCGGVERTSLQLVQAAGVFSAGGSQPLLVVTGAPLHRRPAPMIDVDPDPSDTESYVGAIGNRPGFAQSHDPSLNAGAFDGRNYAHRLLLFTIVTRTPNEVVSLPPSALGCQLQDINNDGSPDQIGGVSHAIMWQGAAPDSRNDFKRSAVVIMEGIDPNNETYPAHWYTLIKALNPDFQSWDPSAGNWGPDLWISEYGWGGANIRQCLIPDAITMLRRIAQHYRARYGHVVPITVVGFSMGGVVGRGALAQLETLQGSVPGTSQLVDLGIKNFLTLDSPHHGAEVHVVLQTLLSQIHTNAALAASNRQGTKRSWLKLDNPAARALLYERCDRFANVDDESDIADLGKCLTLSTLSHDAFYSWLESQGVPNSNGYPRAIRKYAVSLALGKSPGTNSDTYFHGTDPIFKIDFNGLINNAPFVGVGDLWASTPHSQGSTDEAWRGRRNRMPGSRIGIVGSLPSSDASVSFASYDFHLAGMRGYYNPTFIPLTSALGSSIREGRNSLSGFSLYAGSPFDRVWYPIERPSCPPGQDMPCDAPGSPQSWYHDAADIIANKTARGIDDLVGNGQDAAYGFEYPAASDHKISTVLEFISRATESLWPYPAMASLNPQEPQQQWLELHSWINVDGDDVRALDMNGLGTPWRTTYVSRPAYHYGILGSSYQPNSVIQIRGFITPKVSGEYRFRLAARHSAAFRMSRNEYGDTLATLASVMAPGMNRGVWSAQPGQISRTVLLNAGSRYYFDITLKVGSNVTTFEYAHATLEWLTPNCQGWFGPNAEWLMPDGEGWCGFNANEFAAYDPSRSYMRLASDPRAVGRFQVTRSASRDVIRWSNVPESQYDHELLWQNSAGQSGVVSLPGAVPGYSHAINANLFYAYWLRSFDTSRCDAVLRPCPTVTRSQPTTTKQFVVRPQGSATLPPSFANW